MVEYGGEEPLTTIAATADDGAYWKKRRWSTTVPLVYRYILLIVLNEM